MIGRGLDFRCDVTGVRWEKKIGSLVLECFSQAFSCWNVVLYEMSTYLFLYRTQNCPEMRECRFCHARHFESCSCNFVVYYNHTGR